MNRYSRQVILPNFGENAQQKLLQSKVLVIGAGGLGVPVLQYLAAAGIGEIGVIDGDALEISNLQRQVLYSETEIGQNKAQLAVKKLKELNSEIQYQSYDFFIEKNNVFEIIDDYDIIVDCTDNFSTRYLVNDACYLLKKSLVFSSIYRFEAQLSVFHYGKNTFNLRDVFPEMPDENSVPNCNEAGVLGVLAGFAGSLQANEVIKIITGIGVVYSGKLLIFNSVDNSCASILLSKNSNVFLPDSKQQILDKTYHFSCNQYFSVSSLDEINKILISKNSVLIDVREEEEFPKITEFPVKEIPLSKLASEITSVQDYDEMILVCKSGIRSKKAIDLIKEKFPNKILYNVKNGIQIFEK